MNEEEVRGALCTVLPSIDDDMRSYFTSIIVDQGCDDASGFAETLCPFIESYGLIGNHCSAEAACTVLREELLKLGHKFKSSGNDDLHLLNKTTNFNDLSKSHSICSRLTAKGKKTNTDTASTAMRPS
jgi:hypothetical protein